MCVLAAGEKVVRAIVRSPQAENLRGQLLSARRRRKIVSEVIKEIALFRKVTATN